MHDFQIMQTAFQVKFRNSFLQSWLQQKARSNGNITILHVFQQNKSWVHELKRKKRKNTRSEGL